MTTITQKVVAIRNNKSQIKFLAKETYNLVKQLEKELQDANWNLLILGSSGDKEDFDPADLRLIYFHPGVDLDSWNSRQFSSYRDAHKCHDIQEFLIWLEGFDPSLYVKIPFVDVAR